MKGPDRASTIDSIGFTGGEPDFVPYVNDRTHQLDNTMGNPTPDARAFERAGIEPPYRNNYVLHHFNDGSVSYNPRS